MKIREIYDVWVSIKLLIRIIIGLVAGIILAVIWPNLPYLPILGDMFIGALKAIAPILVFLLVIAALSKSRQKLGPQFKVVILLYIVSTIISAVIAVVFDFIHPLTVTLSTSGGTSTVNDFETLISNLANNLVQNPISAIINGNYLGVLFWSVIFGLLLKKYGNDTAIDLASNLSNVVTHVIRVVIEFALWVFSESCTTPSPSTASTSSRSTAHSSLCSLPPWPL